MINAHSPTRVHCFCYLAENNGISQILAQPPIGWINLDCHFLSIGFLSVKEDYLFDAHENPF